MARILLADDSTHAQRMGNKILAAEGLEVVTVSNGEAAVKKLQQTDFDLVLADVFMPGRTGYEICEFVKSSGKHAHIPVVLVVGAMEPYDPDRGKHVKADGLLKKPFEASAMMETVRTLLERVEKAKAAKKAAAAPPPPPVEEEAAQEVVAAVVPSPIAQVEVPQEMEDQPLIYDESVESPAPVAAPSIEPPPSVYSVESAVEEPALGPRAAAAPPVEAASRWVAEPAEVTEADRARFAEPAPEERKPEAAPDWGELLKSVEEPAAQTLAEQRQELESILSDAAQTFAAAAPAAEAAPLPAVEPAILPEPPAAPAAAPRAAAPEPTPEPAEAAAISSDAATIRDAVQASLERVLPALVDEVSSEVLRRLGLQS